MSLAAPPAFSPAQVYALFRAGQYERVRQLASERLSAMPDDTAALTLLALSLQFQGRSAMAVDAYRRLTELQPAVFEHWNNLGNVLRDVGEFAAADAAYRRALGLAPGDAGLLVNLGFLEMEAGKVAMARDRFLDAVRADGGLLDARLYGARACYECGDHATAQDLIQSWRQWGELGDEQYVELGSLLTLLGLAADGEAVLLDALRRTPDEARVLASLVCLYERLNRLDEARDWLSRLPPPEAVRDPTLRRDVISAQVAIATRDADPAHMRALVDQLVPLTEPEHRRAGLHFALGKVCDRHRDSHAAMQAFAQAHACQLRLAEQLVPQLLAPESTALPTAAVRLGAAEFGTWSDPAPPSVEASPIFIVGFPRSGTTMLEQMLDAHPDLASMDERVYINDTIELLSPFGLRYPHDLGKLTPAQCDYLRQSYWRFVAKTVQLAPGQRLVDKNPLNMLRLPMILRLFPRARVILALRHPCDVLLSCYMQHFRSPNFMVMCSTLERLARSYVAAMESWIYHAQLMRPALLVSRYEDLLADFAGNVQRVGGFLGLRDTAPMLSFHEHARGKGYISTPSYTQVIEPPNARAVDRWRRYEDHLAPVRPILQPIMEHWGYAW
ncbi:sulfotransferase [Dokdonella sp.]|uniref:tetratricopeptide repeat-containing sulfotransferase family protein n=1 Tax=Dokdonella sp. TaxID=2291710 RepID=UPI001B28DBDB|nr:sulfotransferase [Dokdonella sp.]MBO9665179.1 sulfotransferase [Dokdonella sp.]